MLSYESRSFSIVDKGYIDFLRLHKIQTHGSYFITREKNNMSFKRMHSRKVDKTTGVLRDHFSKLVTYKSKKEFSENTPNKILRSGKQQEFCLYY